MILEQPASWNARSQELSAFGLEITAEQNASLESVTPELLTSLLTKHSVVVFRGFAPINDKGEFSGVCQAWGELLSWGFGMVFEVTEHPEPKNYLFTNGAVPYHWDGAFAEKAPWLQVFHCREAPGEEVGGETIFCDTAALWRSLTQEQQQRWRSVVVEYATEKIAHYGGNIRAPLVDRHPINGETVLRFAEPANAETVDLNTPELTIEGVAEDGVDDFLGELVGLLYDARFTYSHRWRAGDFVIADNHRVLHGRNPYSPNRPRRLWRVHVLSQEKPS